MTLPSVATARPATSQTACQRSMTRSLPQSTSNYTQIRRARIKRDGSFVGRLTTEITETPLATRIWLEKSHPRRKPAHFNTVYKRNEGWLRKAEGLISPTLFRARRAVSETSVVANPCKRSWSASGHWGAVSTSLPLPPTTSHLYNRLGGGSTPLGLRRFRGWGWDVVGLVADAAARLHPEMPF